MQEKLTIIDWKSEWSVWCYTLLDPFLWISGMLNDVCFRPSSLPFHSQWPRSLQYVYASVCRSHAFGRCCMFPKFLLITIPLFPCCSLSSKILLVISKDYFLNRYKFLIRGLSPLLNGTLISGISSVHYKLLFTTLSFAFVYKHQKRMKNLIKFFFVWKLVKNCFRRWFFAYVF